MGGAGAGACKACHPLAAHLPPPHPPTHPALPCPPRSTHSDFAGRVGEYVSFTSGCAWLDGGQLGGQWVCGVIKGLECRPANTPLCTHC